MDWNSWVYLRAIGALIVVLMLVFLVFPAFRRGIHADTTVADGVPHTIFSFTIGSPKDLVWVRYAFQSE